MFSVTRCLNLARRCAWRRRRTTTTKKIPFVVSLVVIFKVSMRMTVWSMTHADVSLPWKQQDLPRCDATSPPTGSGLQAATLSLGIPPNSVFGVQQLAGGETWLVWRAPDKYGLKALFSVTSDELHRWVVFFSLCCEMDDRCSAVRTPEEPGDFYSLRSNCSKRRQLQVVRLSKNFCTSRQENNWLNLMVIRFSIESAERSGVAVSALVLFPTRLAACKGIKLHSWGLFFWWWFSKRCCGSRVKMWHDNCLWRP